MKKIAVGMIVGTSGLEMPGLQGCFKFADDGLEKWVLVISPSKVSQCELTEQTGKVDTDIMKREL